MTYYLLGTGNMAEFLAMRMNGAGHVCVGLWGRDPDAAAKLARKHHFPLMQRIPGMHDGPDACLLAISDNAIPDVAKDIRLNTTTLIHFAGGVSSGKLAVAASRYGVAWPLYSIRKAYLPVERKFPCIIEGNTNEALGIVRDIARAVSDTVVELSGEQRQWLHTAAVVSNNFTNYLLSIAAEICRVNGIPFMLLQPIMQQLLKNAESQSPRSLQTGPAKRGDTATMAKHLELMQDKPHWQEVYKALSAAIAADFKAN